MLEMLLETNQEYFVSVSSKVHITKKTTKKGFYVGILFPDKWGECHSYSQSGILGE